MAMGELFPVAITRFFMDATPEVLAAAPKIFRLFFPVFLGLGATVLSGYYLQSVLEMKTSMLIGLSHSIFISGAMFFILPRLWGLDGVWLALPLAELIIGTFGVWYTGNRANRKK